MNAHEAYRRAFESADDPVKTGEELGFDAYELRALIPAITRQFFFHMLSDLRNGKSDSAFSHWHTQGHMGFVAGVIYARENARENSERPR